MAVVKGCTVRLVVESQNAQMPCRIAGIRAALVAGVLAVLVCLSLMFAFAPVSAYAGEVDPETQAAMDQLAQEFEEAYEAAQSDGDASVAKGGSAVAIDDDETPLAAAPVANATEEVIADDENPLAASPYAGPVYDFAWVLLVVIIAVAAYFFTSAHRLDKNIRQMRHFVD